MTEALKIYITAEIEKFRQELEKGKKTIKDFAKENKEQIKKVKEELSSVGESAKKGLKTAGVAIAGAATALLALGASTKEYREDHAKLTAAFETVGASADTAKKTFNELFRVLGEDDRSVETANHLAKMTTNQKELSEWTNICQGIFATFGDSLPIEGLTEAANETVKVGQVTGVLADALNWAGVSEDTFNEKLAKLNTEAEREKLIRETLSGLYDDASKSYEKNAADVLKQNEAQAKLNEQMAKIGAVMAPVNAALAEMGATIAEKVAPHIEKFMKEHGEKIKETLTGIADAIGKVINWIADNWELVSTLAIIIGTVSAALGVFSTVMGIVNAVMLASPITWIVLAIVAAVAALVAIIVLCVKHWDDIKAATKKAMDAITDAVKTGIDKVKGFFEKIVNFIKENWQGLLLLIVNPFAGAFKLLYDNCEGFRETINNLVEKIKGFFSGMWDGLKNGAKNAWEGVKSVFSNITGWFKDKFTAAWTAVKNVFSTGGKIFNGIKDGIVSVFKTVVNAIISGINKVISVPFNAINSVLRKLKGIEVLGVKPFSWVSTFSVPQIPQLAKGGIVDSATLAVVGERGKEAIMPLENNTEWIDTLASKINGKNGNTKPTPIILNVDGKTFAQTSINTINDLTRQTGSLKLNIM